MIGKLKDLTFNGDGTQNITVTVGVNFREQYDELKDKPIRIEIKKDSGRRSNNQNSYAWSLIDQIAAASRTKVTEVYRNAIREIGGVSTIVGMQDDAIPVFREIWERGHIGRQIEVIPGSTKPGWSNVRIYYGSSEFDKEQMARLLDILIQDAEALGIPTITPKEAERLIEQWKK